MPTTHILVVEDDKGLREALVDTLCLANYQCLDASSAEEALLILKSQRVDLVISDVQMGGMDGLSLLRNIRRSWPKVPVLLMTAYAKINDAVGAMKDGAVDYLSKPFSPEVLLTAVEQYAPALKVEARTPIYGDPHTAQLLELSKKVAQSDASVLITGPSGAGKEVLSRFIHDSSPRSEQDFVAINCAAIPDNMLEATLFGYEKGAFTGAIKACPGKFEQAQSGTILLDEISEMDLALQAKLLRVLQEKEVERLGSRKTIKLDVRVLATSNRDMRELVDQGRFREDLYYRLNVFPLNWLPLKQRPGDILPLAQHMLQRYQGAQAKHFSQQAKNTLSSYAWPGNVRELENVVQRALILCEADEIDKAQLLIEGIPLQQPATPIRKEAEVQSNQMSVPAPLREESSGEEALGAELRYQEQQIILDTLKACNGKRKDVAEKLGISPRTLRYKLAKIRDSGVALSV
ncbi:sigma-54-dependent Fis family transcriptional regulator [Alginatibacterium sediminis]|uniref:Sigma-54-dependent Fis family transcriptional regulator n=1 Tax=Alginatibacterium sediminis TaxID=2164068 RepID=A0A420EG65_9ALTE|nr:sigma-54 dependent transcriptional regulator [Alginatibacterium sediminis]RKF19654.1 sigma-54-dependent Fis family transcriptional regulator [Alginatibacterium sediminis]